MQTTIPIETNQQGVMIVPLQELQPLNTREYKVRVVGNELIIYPAHLKFREVATPQQRANLILERLTHHKPNPSDPQIPDEALRRENMYE